MITDKLLLSEIHQLPENLKEDVFHYVTFLKTRFQQTESKKTTTSRKFGSAKGKYQLSPDFDQPLEDFNDYI